jgi:hypothetical protein
MKQRSLRGAMYRDTDSNCQREYKDSLRVCLKEQSDRSCTRKEGICDLSPYPGSFRVKVDPLPN